jgi:hypothetical protein
MRYTVYITQSNKPFFNREMKYFPPFQCYSGSKLAILKNSPLIKRQRYMLIIWENVCTNLFECLGAKPFYWGITSRQRGMAYNMYVNFKTFV